jgi:predicted ATP-dependent endonuclease of OLD family
MFYEKCFVLLEGETETNALPVFYRTLYKHSLLEDGIRLINMKGNGATKEFLRLIGRNKQEMAITLLDKDTEDENRGETAKLTRAEFKEACFSEEFIKIRMIYIGAKEFEDAFSDDVLARSLQIGFPKSDGIWTAADIAQIRADKKMSDALGRIVHENANPSSQKWGKPEFGKCLGRLCSKDEIPQELIKLFDLARRVSGCQ